METLAASVQYNDIKGQVALDENDNSGIQELAKQNGIDIDTNFPIAFYLHAWDSDKPSVSIITTATAHDGYDNVKDYIQNNDPIEVKKFTFELSYNDFFKYFKRVSIVGTPIDIAMGKEYVEV
jgi:hypothetical protein